MAIYNLHNLYHGGHCFKIKIATSSIPPSHTHHLLRRMKLFRFLLLCILVVISLDIFEGKFSFHQLFHGKLFRKLEKAKTNENESNSQKSSRQVLDIKEAIKSLNTIKFDDSVSKIADRMISSVIIFYSIKLVLQSLAITFDQILSRFENINSNQYTGINRNLSEYLTSNLSLSSYESEILSSIILPKSVKFTFNEIGGLEIIKANLIRISKENLIDFSIKSSNFSIPDIYSPTRSFLLYGPPGCGNLIKTIKMVE